MKRTRYFPSWFDLALLVVAAALFATGAKLVQTSPEGWIFYLNLLDIRVWPPWKSIGLVILLVESVVVMRYWPGGKRRAARTDEHE